MADNLLLGTNEFIRFEQELACYIGLNEAIILQKVHRLLQLDNFGQRDNNGVKWVRMTIDEWSDELPFLDAGQIKRALKNIVTDGLILVTQFTGRSNWYTVVYDAISKLDAPVGRLEAKRKKRKIASDAAKDEPNEEPDREKNGDDTLHNVSGQNDLLGQNEPIHQVKMNRCIGSKWTASNSPSNSPSNNYSTNAHAQENSGQKIGPLTAAVLDVCGQDFVFVSKNKWLKDDMLATVELLSRLGATDANVYEFREWQKTHHWTSGRPTFVQVGKYWQEFLDWIKAGRPAVKNGASTNGHQNSDNQPAKKPVSYQPLSWAERRRQKLTPGT